MKQLDMNKEYCSCDSSSINNLLVLRCEDDYNSILIKVHCETDIIIIIIMWNFLFCHNNTSHTSGRHTPTKKIATYSSTIVLLVIVDVFSIQVLVTVPVLMCMLILTLTDNVSVVEKARMSYS